MALLIFKSLSSTNYRFFFMGQAFSNLGNMMKQVAVGWLVYRLTGSALLLGVVSFSREIAAFLFSTVAGVLADRYNKHRLLMVCQSLIAVNAIILALLTITDAISFQTLLALEIVFGLVSGMEMPSRHAFVNDLVEDKTYLTNAIALNSSLFNTARIVGPALAGILIPIIGEGYCFLLYAVASSAVVVIFTYIEYRPSGKKRKGKNFAKEFREGAVFSIKTRHIRFLILFVAGITLIGVSYMVILPVMAAEVFMGDAVIFGYMTSAVGIGSLLGAFFVGARNNVVGLDKLILLGTLIFGLGLAVFSFSTILWLSLLALITTGLGRVIIFTGSNTLLQTIAPEEKRGRVLSFYIMLFMGALSLGSFLIGLLTDWMGAPFALMMGSLGVLVMGLYYAKSLPLLRKRTYRAIKKSELLT
ncbi:Predicted arabinose efflux permease, MFS family [Cyclobacterium lianum]|uniref:Predicted arabinose efflux permease, MFS family n=1 Tax=Cyclobacterium lianum TaxID=388280 RepID=A0A1M7LBT7_9BACT|nr:MFS transporter [Cyclobacterium lianum]SHM75448.1 Predicted arabinose efflux permease, MFS family [Cyclobacterium lianum]